MNPRLDPTESQSRATAFHETMHTRRTVRDFSPDPIPDGVLNSCLATAHSAPSGANLQPWHFAVIESPEVKQQIREAAEAEEREFYESRAPQEWLEALQVFQTTWHKPFLETAPALIAIFQKNRVTLPDGRESKTYYPKESTGIATGFLIAALHQAGLATLTHTPSPMNFLNELLDRPSSENPSSSSLPATPAPIAPSPKSPSSPSPPRSAATEVTACHSPPPRYPSPSQSCGSPSSPFSPSWHSFSHRLSTPAKQNPRPDNS